MVGDEATAGKSLGTDLEKQKPTLPVIRALQVADAAQRVEILAILAGDRGGSCQTLWSYFKQLDVVAYAREKARAFAEQALQQLTLLPESPAKRSLRRMAEFVVNRSY